MLAGTDLGGARRRLATLFATITAEISGRFIDTLATAGAEFERTQTVRRELVRRVIALDPAIDEAFGESSQLRYHSPVLQTGGGRSVVGSGRLADGGSSCSRDCRSRAGAARGGCHVLAASTGATSHRGSNKTSRHVGSPTRHACSGHATRRCGGWSSLPAGTPSLRLLADQTAEVAGWNFARSQRARIARCRSCPAGFAQSRPARRLRIADWLPSLVNAGRAFVVIGAAELFWIVTAWPNGAGAITFAAIGVILFAPRADQAYADWPSDL